MQQLYIQIRLLVIDRNVQCANCKYLADVTTLFRRCDVELISALCLVGIQLHRVCTCTM